MNYSRDILQSFAESSGDANVLALSLERKQLIARLPDILSDAATLDALVTGYLRRHPDLPTRHLDEYRDLDDQGFVIAIITFGLKELTQTAEMRKVVAKLDQMIEAHRKTS